MKKIALILSILFGVAFSAEFVVPNSSGEKINEISGVTYSKNEAALSSKTGGFIKSFSVEEGEFVKAGQTLFEIDQNEAMAGKDAAKASFDEAAKNLDRYKKLLEQGVISQNEFEKTEINYAAKKSLYTQSENGVKYAIVKAPFSGVVTKKFFSVGSFVSPSQPVIIVQDLKSVRFKANAGEAAAKNLSVNMPVSIKVAGKSYDAKISSLTNSSAMNYEIKADFTNKDAIAPGLYATLEVKQTDNSAFSVPPSVLTKRGGIIGVFANVNGIAKFTPVKIVQERADSVLVSGLKPAMRLIVSPKASLIDGGKAE